MTLKINTDYFPENHWQFGLCFLWGVDWSLIRNPDGRRSSRKVCIFKRVYLAKTKTLGTAHTHFTENASRRLWLQCLVMSPKRGSTRKLTFSWQSDLQLVSLKPVHYSTTQTGRLMSVKLTADNDDINIYRLDVGYTVISCFFRRLILYNRSVTWRKYDFWCDCALKDGRPPSFEYWL